MAQNPTPSRRLRWIFLVAVLIVLGVVGTVVFYFNSKAFQQQVRRQVIAQLETATGGRVELRRVNWSTARLQIDVDDLTIHGLENPSDVPYAHVDHAHLSFKVLSWLKREFGLREIDLDHPAFHLLVYPNGSTNQPHPRSRNGVNGLQQLFAVRIDQLRATDGLLLLNDRRFPFDVNAQSIQAELSYLAPRSPGYRGQIEVGNLQLKRPGTTVISSAKSNFTIENNKLQVNAFSWSSGKSQVDATGAISDFSHPKVNVGYNATLELSRVGTLLGAPELRNGMATISGTLRYVSTEDFFASGTLQLTDGNYWTNGLRLNSVSARAAYTVDVDRISLTKIAGGTLGGTFNGTASLLHWVKLPPKTGLSAPGTKKQTLVRDQQGSIALQVSGVELAAALRAVLPQQNALNRLRVASAAAGKVTVTWFRSPALADTVIDLDTQAPTNTRPDELPLSGSIRATYHGRTGALDVAGINLAGRATRVSATGAIGAQSRMRVSLNTSDLSELTPVMRALGSSEGPMPAILHGQASFNGTVNGTVSSPSLSGHLQATNFDTLLPALKVEVGALGASVPAPPLRQIHWDSLTADVTYSPTSATARNVLLKRGRAQITGSETAGLIDGQLEPDSPVQIRLGLQNTDIADFQTLFGSNYPVTGTFSGQVTLTGTKENLNASGRMQLLGGAMYGEPYHSFTANLMLQDNVLTLRNMVLAENGGRATGSASYGVDSQNFSFDLNGSNFELAHVERLRNARLSLGGRAGFSATGSGTLEHPILNAKISIAGLSFNGESAGDLIATAATQAGKLHVEAHTNTTIASASVAGDIDMDRDLFAELHLDLHRLDFDPLLRAYLPTRITGHSSVSGKFILRGPLRHPHDIVVTADVDQFYADIQNLKLQNQGPLRFSLSKEVVTIDELHIVGTDTDVTGTGKVELSGPGRLDLHGTGHVNLALLQNFTSNLSSSGEMTFTVNTSGSLSDPNFAGNVQITNGAVAFVDLPNGLSELNGTLSFDRNRLRVQKLTGKTGGGDIVLGGYVTYANGIFFDLTGSGRAIRIRYPEGVSSQAMADVRLVGTLQNSVLSGDVTITKFGLTPQFDLAAYVQRAKQPPAPPNPNSIVDNVRLDLHITSTPELRVETSMARLAGDVDIHLRGTAARPSIMGRVSIAEGDITFNSTTYHLERGDIVFANPVRIEPVVNVEASARVRDYDITLGFHGTPDKLNVTYRSEPPLPSADIIALLAFGRTRQESEVQAEQGSQAASEQSFAQTASNAILGEALNSAVSSRVQKLFGISRIKIDPNLGGTEDNPNARLTIEQQISKDVTVTYLTNLGQYAEEVLQVEYNINKNISLVAVRDYTGVLAIDLRIRQRKR